MIEIKEVVRGKFGDLRVISRINKNRILITASRSQEKKICLKEIDDEVLGPVHCIDPDCSEHQVE